MCGIHLLVSSEASIRDSHSAPEWLLRRGPDHVGTVQMDQYVFQASVLRMRHLLVEQPVPVAAKSHLAWNGEIYRAYGTEMQDMSSMDIADTEIVAGWVQDLLNDSNSDTLAGLARLFGRIIDGEFAFCLVTEDAVFYGRDPWGRRSLLIQKKNDRGWRLASVAEGIENTEENPWTEVIPGKVHCHVLATNECQSLQFCNDEKVCVSSDSKYSGDEDQLVARLENVLFGAVQRRINCHPKIAVLFSGGLDSVVLAGLAARLVDELVLVNVDFVLDQTAASNDSSAADTIAALESFEELRARNPDTKIRLIQRTVTWEEISCEEERVRHLIYPKSTTMDLNIAAALWFAADTAAKDEGYTDRVLLSGLGADELFGGYTRHRTAYEKDGMEGLRRELSLDQSRLWDRNFGRDDRIYSDTGQEARFPYLDHDVTKFSDDLPLDLCCKLDLPPGQGDKWILRQVAAKMGLGAASTATKRAIQFGSRMAQVCDRKRFGSRRKARGTGRSN